MGSLIISQTVN